MKNNYVNDETKKIIKSSWKVTINKLFITIFLRGFLLLIPILFSNVINEISKQNYDLAYRNVWILIIVIILYYFSEWINQIAYYRLYNFLYSKYSKLALKATSTNSTFSLSRFSLGEYTNIMNNDIATITTFFCSCALWIVRIIEFIYIYYYFFTIDSTIFVITIVLSLLMVMVSVLSGDKIEKRNVSTKRALDDKTAMVHEMFLGIKEIKCLNIFRPINYLFEKKCAEYLDNNADYNVFANAISYVIYGTISVAKFIVVFYSIKLIMNGHMEIGVLLVLYDYYGKIVDNFSVVTSINVEVRNLNVSLHRFNKILENAYNNKTNALVNKNEFEGRIHFANILYGYKDKPTLKNVTFDIKERSITVITGNMNVNKACVFELLLKLNRPHIGEIYIDDTNINSIKDKVYYDLVTLVNKEPYFFDLSIKENLMFVTNNFDIITDTCKQLGIHDYIMSLPKGYDSKINDKVLNIPVEVRQLLGIARVLIKKPKIILIDETISMLEKEKKENIFKLLLELKKEHTIILTSKEDDVLKLADQVLVLEENQIKEAFNLQKKLKNVLHI